MIPAISQICSLNAPFGEDVAEYAAGKCPAVEVWLTKLEQFLRTHPVAAARQLLDEQQMALAAASLQGGILGSEGAAREEAWRLFQQRLQLCAELGVPTLVIAADLPGPVTQQLLDRTLQSLRAAAAAAEPLGLRLALEFQVRSAFINNLQTAAAVVEEINSPHLGICLDTFHFAVGPSKLQDLSYLTPANLFHVQVCDLIDTTRELACDSDRILPGDGDIELSQLVAQLKGIGYAGYVAVEVMNPQLWQVPPREFGEISMTAVRRVLGLADAGG